MAQVFGKSNHTGRKFLVIEIDEVPNAVVFADVFSVMRIFGEDGIAVVHENGTIKRGVSVSIDGDRRTLVRLGEDPLAVLTIVEISSSDCERVLSIVSQLQPRNGLVAAEVLDGESFFIRWLTSGREYRFVLCNPIELESCYSEIGEVLRRFLTVAFETTGRETLPR